MFDLVAILREAHAATKARRAPSRSQRYGDRYDPELTACVPKASYRAIFAAKLRNAWHVAKYVAAEAAYEASLPPLPADVLARADAIRADARGEPFTDAGHDRYVAAHLAADALLEAARYGAAS